MPAIMKSLNNISRCQATFRAEKLNAEGLCSGHHAFVLAICHNPGRSQEELAKELCLNKSTVARVLTNLEEQGYIIRKSDKEDKRKFLVFPTEKMLKIFPKVRAVAKEWNSLISADISEEEMAVFYSVLAKMEESARNIVRG